VFDLLSQTTELRDKLEFNTKYFREKMTEAGFDIKPGDHPIVPIMLYDAVVAQNFAARLLEEGDICNWIFLPRSCKRPRQDSRAIKRGTRATSFR
jgi:glycine C-acetyltransferase